MFCIWPKWQNSGGQIFSFWRHTRNMRHLWLLLAIRDSYNYISHKSRSDMEIFKNHGEKIGRTSSANSSSIHKTIRASDKLISTYRHITLLVYFAIDTRSSRITNMVWASWCPLGTNALLLLILNIGSYWTYICATKHNFICKAIIC